MIRRLSVVVAGVLTLGLAACGTDGPRGPFVERDVVKGERATVAEAPTPPDRGEGEDPGGTTASGTPATRVLPLDTLWESAYGRDPEVEAARARRVEELTAQCMAGAGFDYLPVAVADVGTGDVEWGTREFAERYGYGASTDPWNVYLDQADPNDDYVATLTDAELEDYLAALYGDWSRYDDWTEEERESYVWTWETNGCNGWAQHEADPAVEDVERFEALWVDLEAMWTAAANDPRMRVASERWAACMADAGHPGLVDPQDSEYRFHDEVDALYDEVYGALDWQSPETDWAAADREAEDRLAAITAREITTATIDWDCRAETGYDDVEHEVLHEYESGFLATHGAEVDAYLATVAAGNV